MKGAIKIFRIFGIDIKLHLSWWLVFIFLAWSLSTGFFPQEFPNYIVKEYWFMGITAALLLFVSVLLHELSHSLVAKARNIKVEDITLFFFGGVAGIADEDMKPSSEFLMAIAGPIFSLLLAGSCYFIFKTSTNGLLTPIIYYLALVNLMLAAFNLVPAFPLDGGRAFRAVLYAYFKDLRKATKIAANGGRFFAIFLIITGIFAIIMENFAGLWFVILGAFLYFIAGLSYEQVVLKETLMKIPLREMIIKKYSGLKPKMVFRDFVNKYYRSGEEVFWVRDKNFSGILDLKAIGSVSKPLQESVKLNQLAVPISQFRSLDPNDNSYTAFKSFAQQNAELLPVSRKGKIIGFARRRSIMQRLIWALKYGAGLKEKGKKKGSTAKSIINKQKP